MKIGAIAQHVGVSPRLIRYYEQQGLLSAKRSTNGYRSYSESDAARLERIVSLVQAGVSTKLVKVLLDAEDAEARQEETCPRDVAELLAAELVGLESRISCLTRSRDTIRNYLDRTRDVIAVHDAVE